MTNPYIPPDAELTPAPNNHEQPGHHAPVSLPAGRGIDWVRQGFDFFKQDPGTWVLITIVGALVMIGINTIPLVSLVGGFFTYVFSAGLMLGAKAQDDGESLTLGHLFAGFKNSFSNLLALGAISIGYSIVAVIIAFGTFLLNLNEFSLESLQQNLNIQSLLVAIMLLLVLLTPLFMGIWFSPALIVINQVPVFQAIILSIQACLKNVMPLTIYGLILMLLFIAGAIPFMLGLLVVMPIYYASIYISYREIFIDP